VVDWCQEDVLDGCSRSTDGQLHNLLEVGKGLTCIWMPGLSNHTLLKRHHCCGQQGFGTRGASYDTRLPARSMGRVKLNVVATVVTNMSKLTTDP
jgi:hypothetical protein